MKAKSARRFLARNQWKLVKNQQLDYADKKLAAKEREAKRVLGDIRFRQF